MLYSGFWRSFSWRSESSSLSTSYSHRCTTTDRRDYPLWRIVNWFMAAGVLIALVVNLWRRRTLATDASVLEYVRTSVAFYGTIVLTMLFFWEWFWTLNPESETGDAVTSHLIYFPIMDSLFVVIALATGGHLWSDVSDSEA